MYPSSSVAPRSILKQQYAATDRVYSAPKSPDRLHAVRFPPSPTLTRVYVAHSSTTYDRSPIVVSPNACALPERGCPGRTYTLDDERPNRSSPSKRGSSSGNHAHPRAASNRASSSPSRPVGDGPIPMRTSPLVRPPLIPDLSSESEESDGFIRLPPSMSMSMAPAPSIPKPRIRGDNDSYSGERSSSGNGLPSFPSYRSSPEDPHKARRRRQRDRSRERERNQTREYSYASDETSSDGCYKPFALGYALHTAGDGGCLGGF